MITATPDPLISEANLQDALALAIRHQREAEAKISPTFCSCFRAGLESNLAAMRAGMKLDIRYHDNRDDHTFNND